MATTGKIPTTTTSLLLFSLLLPLLSLSAAARPCKTIFFISTTTTTLFPSDQFQNPNPNPNPNHLTFFITEVHRVHNPTTSPFSRFDRPLLIDRFNNPTRPFSRRPIFIDIDRDDVSKQQQEGIIGQDVGSSIRDRTMDIMSIVGALLFGVGCGALTAATMYLIWSLFSPRRFDFGESDDEFDGIDENDDDVSPKKMGYVAIPAAGVVTTVAAPAKEV